jgi:hypothetical protein
LFAHDYDGDHVTIYLRFLSKLLLLCVVKRLGWSFPDGCRAGRTAPPLFAVWAVRPDRLATE